MEHPKTAVAYPLWLRITEICAELGINQTQLWKRTGVRFATIKGWRTATRSPQPRLINEIVEALNAAAREAGKDIHLDPAEARRLAGIVPSPSAPPGAPFPSVDDIRHSIQLNQNFTPAQREALFHVIAGFEAQNSATAASQQADPDPPGRDQ